MDDEIVTLASFSDPFEAAHVKGLLEDEGIRVFQSGDQTTSLFAGIGGGFFGSKVDLMVAEKDLPQAQSILRQASEDAEDEDEEEDEAAAESSTAITGDAPAPKGEAAASDAVQAKPPTKWAAVTQGPAADEADEADEDEEEEDDRPAIFRADHLVKLGVGILLVFGAIVVLFALFASGSTKRATAPFPSGIGTAPAETKRVE